MAHYPDCWGYPGCYGCLEDNVSTHEFCGPEFFGTSHKVTTKTAFQVGGRIRVTGKNNILGARVAEYTVTAIDEAGYLACGDASDGGPDQYVDPRGAELVYRPLPVADVQTDVSPEAVDAVISEHARRKAQPLARGVLDYFGAALAAVAEVSRVGGEQHHPGEPIHWVWAKSADHADCLLRHLTDRGTLDSDGLSHTAKVAWRALALLQTELENADPELHAKYEQYRELAKQGKR